MLDMKQGISVIKGCDLKISTTTTMADIFSLAPEYIGKVTETNNGYKHVQLFCNDGLNYESENDLWLTSYGDGKLMGINVHSKRSNLFHEEERRLVAEKCRRWLAQHGQMADRAIYDWGGVFFTKGDMDFSLFIGIQILFRCPYYKHLFEESGESL